MKQITVANNDALRAKLIELGLSHTPLPVGRYIEITIPKRESVRITVADRPEPKSREAR